MKWIPKFPLVKIYFLARNIGALSLVCYEHVHSRWFVSFKTTADQVAMNCAEPYMEQALLGLHLSWGVRMLEPKLSYAFPYINSFYSVSPRIECVMQWDLVLNPNESIITLCFLFWISLGSSLKYFFGYIASSTSEYCFHIFVFA